MKAIFVRHGKEDERYRGGWSDLDLIPEGVEQAKKLAKHLKAENQEYNITQILSSDLPRAMTTADLLAAELGLPVQKEARLREVNNGVLAGMPDDTARERYPGLFFSSLQMDEAYPNGESPRDFYKRVKMWFEEFAAECRGTDGSVLVVTHGGVINILYHLVNRMEWDNRGGVFRAANCSLHIVNMETMEFEVENRHDFLDA